MPTTISAEVWHVANSKISTKAVNKTLKTFILYKSKNVKIHEKSRISRNFTEMGVFRGRRPISRKMSLPWNRELGWSLQTTNNAVHLRPCRLLCTLLRRSAYTCRPYTVSHKNKPNLAGCIFVKHWLILIILGKQHQHTFKNKLYATFLVSFVYFICF